MTKPEFLSDLNDRELELILIYRTLDKAGKDLLLKKVEEKLREEQQERGSIENR